MSTYHVVGVLGYSIMVASAMVLVPFTFVVAPLRRVVLEPTDGQTLLSQSVLATVQTGE